MATHRYKGRSAEGEGRPFFTFNSIQLISAKVWFRSILLLHQVLGGRFLWDLPLFYAEFLTTILPRNVCINPLLFIRRIEAPTINPDSCREFKFL